MPSTTDFLAKLAAAWDDITSVDGVEPREYEHYGLWFVECDGEEWAIGTDDEADEAAREAIESSVWAFNADFLVEHMAIPHSIDSIVMRGIQELQRESCEDCNDELREAITDFDEFVSDAIAADGRAHFLNTYDDKEYTAKSAGGTMLYLYRVN